MYFVWLSDVILNVKFSASGETIQNLWILILLLSIQIFCLGLGIKFSVLRERDARNRESKGKI